MESVAENATSAFDDAVEDVVVVVTSEEGEGEVSSPDRAWLNSLQGAVSFYVIPALAAGGVAFNAASMAFLRQKEVRLRRSLVTLFTFLNFFDSLFLISTFLVFSLPDLSSWYQVRISSHLTPYLLPALQTCLSISVFSTVAIAIAGHLIVNPLEVDSPIRDWIKFSRVDVAALAALVIFVLAALLNLPRWFELKTEFGENGKYVLVLSELRRDPDYVQYYSLLFSSVSMLFVPFTLLLGVCFSIRRSAVVSGSQKRKTLRLMSIIILMFLVCHLPKVIVTIYEVSYHRLEEGRIDNWSTWARVTKELSHILLISYSALNPLAYCGDLVVRSTLERLCGGAAVVCCRRGKASSGGGGGGRGGIRRSGRPVYCCCVRRDHRSEIEIMESAGVTVRGGDSIEQQLRDLDPQSRILSGLGPTKPPSPQQQHSGATPKSSSHSSSLIQPLQCPPPPPPQVARVGIGSGKKFHV